MSFIGAGELEHKVTQLQRQLDHRDHELNSIKNEQKKREEEFVAAKRAKEDAEYKLSNEAERAHQSEKSMKVKTDEIFQLKLKLSNLESSLEQANDKLKKEEKDNEKIQSALDVALNSGTDGVAEQIKTLQSRIKHLEGSLKSAEQEKEQLRSQGNSNDFGEPLSRGERNRLMVLQNQVESLREENARLQASGSSKSPSTDIFASSSSPSRPKTKRRSMSVSGPAPSEMIELENQISTLQEQLMQRKKDLDKAVNEKLAAEIASKKKIQKLESDMEDIKEELDFYRRNQDGNAASQEVEKVKKAMQMENDNLRSRLQDKEGEVSQKLEQIKDLEKKAELVIRLEADLEKERNVRQSLEDATTAANTTESSAQLEEAEEKIKSLQADLAKARLNTNSNASSSKVGDTEIRQLKRELTKAVRDKEYLESLVEENDILLKEKDEEISRMRTAIPVPGSPVLGASINGERLEKLEAEKIALEDKLDQQVQERNQEVKEIEARLHAASREVESISTVKEGLMEELAKAREEAETSNAQRDHSEGQLKKTIENLSAKEAELALLHSEIDQLRTTLLNAQNHASTTQQECDDMIKQFEDTKSSLKEKDTLLHEIISERDHLQSTLSTRSRNDADYSALEATLEDYKIQWIEHQSSSSKLEEEKTQLQISVTAIENQHRLARQEVLDLSANLTALEKQLDEKEEEAKNLSIRKDDTIQSLTDEVSDLKADVSLLQIKLDDKIAELAVSTSTSDKFQIQFEEAIRSYNEAQAKVTELEEAQADRSTEGEARGKDEELFQLKEEKQHLAEALAVAKAEYETESASNTFKIEQDLLEAQKKISSLEKQIQDLQSALSIAQSQRPSKSIDTETYNRMEQKIIQLRSERDDLRHNLSFVQNERQFAIRAATSDKDAALENVRKTKEELKQSSRAYEKLQVELQDAQNNLDKNNAKSNTANDEEKQQLSEHISTLQGELDSHFEKVKSLEADLQAREDNLATMKTRLELAETRAEGLQKELLEMVHHVGQTTKLSDPPRHSPTAEESSDLPTDLVANVGHGHVQSGDRSRRTSLGHMRSRSNASISTMPIFNNDEKRQLQAKVARREARIEELVAQLEKLTLNLNLANDAQEETLEERAVLMKEKNRLQAELNDALVKAPEIKEIQVEVEVEVEVEHPQMLRDLVLALVMHRQSVKSAERRWNVSKDILNKSRNTADQLRATIHEAEREKSEDSQRFIDLQEEKAALEVQLTSLQTEESSARFVLQEARKAIETLESRISTYEAENINAAESAVAISAIEAQVAEKEGKIRELEAQNVEYTTQIATIQQELRELKVSRDEEMSLLNTKINDLEEKVSSSQDRVKELESEKEGLGEEIAAAEKALEEGMIDALTERENIESRYKEVEARVLELEVQLQEKVDQLQAAIEKATQIRQELEVARNKAREISDISEQDKATVEQLQKELHSLRETTRDEIEARVSDLEAQLKEKVEQLEQAIERTTQVQRELEVAQEKAREFSDISEQDKAVIAGLENELASLKETSQGDSRIISELRNELSSIRETSTFIEEERRSLTTEITSLKDMVSSANHEKDTLKIQLANTSIELAEMRNAKDIVDNLVLQVRAELASSEEGKKIAEGSLEEIGSRVENLTAQLSSTKEELTASKEQIQAVTESSAKRQIELDNLQAENVDLKAQLEKVQSTPAAEIDETLVNDLKERIEQLEMSLTQKTEEVDEADDRTREAFKTNAKLEKKLGKLQRQLETAQVEKNTALNKLATQPSLPIQSSTSAPVMNPKSLVVPNTTNSTSVPSPAQIIKKPRVVSAPTPTQRTPLSSVNIFKPSTENTASLLSPPPSLERKRHREDDPIKPIQSVDAIMQPPPTNISINHQHKSPSKPLVTHKSSFTPQRGQNTRPSVFSNQNNNEGIDITKQKLSFPAPPTRSVFQPR
ncbi:uncharacterized protein L201_006596 [Kwoniella dendrophila CBS 6074]|uniref:Nucleoprotein TPR/MLP1 domain-containing protein n=1 Tax=Kwoniella dendrophila CBS 6074 TaxID=1295534 RepID=A0AAX4K4F7_9TREE